MKETVAVTLHIPRKLKKELFDFYKNDDRGFSRLKLQEIIISCGLQAQPGKGVNNG